jgi:hypothetical protein
VRREYIFWTEHLDPLRADASLWDVFCHLPDTRHEPTNAYGRVAVTIPNHRSNRSYSHRNVQLKPEPRTAGSILTLKILEHSKKDKKQKNKIKI